MTSTTSLFAFVSFLIFFYPNIYSQVQSNDDWHKKIIILNKQSIEIKNNLEKLKIDSKQYSKKYKKLEDSLNVVDSLRYDFVGHNKNNIVYFKYRFDQLESLILKSRNPSYSSNEIKSLFHEYIDNDSAKWLYSDRYEALLEILYTLSDSLTRTVIPLTIESNKPSICLAVKTYMYDIFNAGNSSTISYTNIRNNLVGIKNIGEVYPEQQIPIQIDDASYTFFFFDMNNELNMKIIVYDPSIKTNGRVINIFK
jgi:hypothetical protein